MATTLRGLMVFKYIGSKINEILVGQNVIDVKSVINTGITWSFRWGQPTTIEARSSMFPKGICCGKDIYDKDLKMVWRHVETRVRVDT